MAVGYRRSPQTLLYGKNIAYHDLLGTEDENIFCLFVVSLGKMESVGTGIWVHSLCSAADSPEGPMLLF